MKRIIIAVLAALFVAVPKDVQFEIILNAPSFTASTATYVTSGEGFIECIEGGSIPSEPMAGATCYGWACNVRFVRCDARGTAYERLYWLRQTITTEER